MNTRSTLFHYLLVCLSLLLSLPSLAQNQPLDCGTDQNVAQRLATDSTYRRFYQNLKPNQNKGGVDTTTVYTIPVVFVIYHLGEAVGTGSNVSEADLQGQIDQMNRMFAGQRPDYLGPDAKIRFALAQRTSSCTAFNGIARVDARNVPGYEATGLDWLDTRRADQLRKLVPEYIDYLNDRFVVVRVAHQVSGAGGWANYGGDIFVPAGEMKNTSPYNNLLTHEMGHSLFLRHTFDGNDFINENYVCPSNTNPEYEGDFVADTDPHKKREPDNACDPASENAINTCTGQPFGLIGRNHMSYGCNRILFTRGQMIRMRSYFTENSKGLLNSPYLNPPQAGEAVVAACVPTVVTSIGSTNEGLKSLYFQQINRQTEFGSHYMTGHYFDYSCTERATVTAGQSYSLSLIGEGRFRRVYIDYNNDGSFDEGTERVLTEEVFASGRQVSNGLIIIPTNAVMGPYLRMRVVVNGGSVAPTACNLPNGQDGSGEAHDYGVRVLPATTPASLSIGTLVSAYVCRNQQFNVPIITEGLFDVGNMFTIQLSDATGSFQNPIAIGSSSGSPVPVQLPLSVALGDDYRMRVVSSNPALTSLPGPTLTLDDLPTATVSGSQTLSAGQTATLTITLTGRPLPRWSTKINRAGETGFKLVDAFTSPTSITFVPQTTDIYTLEYIRNVCGNGTVSGSVTITVPCTTPTSLSESAVSANAALLYWDFILGFGSAVSYDIQWKEATAANWNLIQNLLQAGYQLGGLDPTKTYQWRIRKVCTDGASDWSAVHPFSTGCRPPTQYEAYNQLPDKVILSWNAPSEGREQVRLRPVGAANWQESDTTTQYTVAFLRGLPGGASYEWQVRTVCSDSQTSAYSNSGYFIALCPIPTSLSANNAVGTSIGLLWNNTLNATYNLRWRIVGTGTWTTVSSVSTTSHTLTGLNIGVDYEYQVQTVCSASLASDFSGSYTFAIPCPTPTQNGQSINANTVNLFFGGIAPYQIRWRAVGNPTWTESSSLISGFYQLTNLSYGESYEWQARSLCSPGNSSAYSGSGTFLLPCPVPGNPVVSSVGSSTARLSWFGPAGNTYELRWRTVGSPDWTTVSSLTSGPYNLTGLTTGTTYEWQVRAVCSATLTSAYTTSLTFVPVCRTAQFMSEAAIAGTQARVSWFMQGNLTYRIEWRAVGSATWQSSTTAVWSSNGSTYLLTGLTTGTTYEWRVVSICDGTPTPSVSRTFTAQCGPLTGSLSIQNVTSRGATLYWNGPQFLPNVAYRVRYRPTGTTTWTESLTTTGLSIRVDGLLNNTTYEWQVQMICDGLPGDYSGSGTSFSTNCVAVTANIPNPGDISVRLVWLGVTGEQYELDYRVAGAPNWTTISSLTVTEYNLPVTPGTAYEWRVRTMCSDGNTLTSNVVSFTTLPACDPLEPNNNAQTASSVAGNSFTTVVVCINRPGDEDWFRWTFNGETYYVVVRGFDYYALSSMGEYVLTGRIDNGVLTVSTHSANGSTTNTSLTLYAADGLTQRASNNDWNGTPFSQITYTLPAPCTVMTTVKNGNWIDPTVWSCYRTPISTDTVQILHTVTMPYSGTARALQVQYGAGGKLIMDTGTRLMLGQ